MHLSAYLEKHKLSQKEFGAKLGVSQGMVWQWIRWLEDQDKGTRITAERAVQIEAATRGEVKRHHLRPDLFKARAA